MSITEFVNHKDLFDIYFICFHYNFFQFCFQKQKKLKSIAACQKHHAQMSNKDTENTCTCTCRATLKQVLRQKDEDEDVCSFTKHAKELEKKNTARGLTKSLLLIVKETLNVLLLTKIVKQWRRILTANLKIFQEI